MPDLGFGYWALVAAIVFTGVSNCLLLNFIVVYPRIPSFRFQGTRELFAFGAFVAMSEILFVAYNRVDVAISGRFVDTAQIGLYGVAIQLATMR
ncbi:MAG: oligosaccharide flippase family protein [Halioglobus sp.]|nr:oligosaccharide flippase family protein [Halioglobus sp.]